jgi:hypothetical protein
MIPTASAATDGDDYLVRARALIEQAIRRRWAEGLITKDADGVFTAFLGAEHVERLMRGPSPNEPHRIIDAHAFPVSTPLGLLVAALNLRDSEADLLAVLLACETDPACARLVTYLGGNQQQFSLTFDLLFDIVYRGREPQQSEAAALMHVDVSPYSRLRRLRYLVVDGADSRAALGQGIRLHPRITSWLMGQSAVDPELAALSRLHSPSLPPGECDGRALEAVIAAFRAGGRLILVEGLPQVGRELLLRFAAAEIGRPILCVSGRGLGADRVVSAFREATLQRALLAFLDGDEALEGENVQRFRECLNVYGGTVAIVGNGRIAPTLSGLRPTTAVAVKVPEHGERARLWGENLGRESGLSDDDVRQIAALYNLGTSGIVTASHTAVEMAAFAGVPLAREHVSRAVRQLFEADLATIATRVEVTQSWEDLVLPEDLAESVVGIIDRIRYRGDVLGKWGFARKLGKGLGLTVLFSGEPGTGKSMAAGLIARELGLDLYVVDLSRVTSKWLGETEKNLGRAFDAAEAGHVLLLFDEADSILGKRTSNIQHSNDRHANLETNFILARIEQFNGIAFFTTNLPSAIDPAVSRRMSMHVSFPFPDVATRADLWRRMVPAEAPVQENVDFQALAERYELSGGFIRNIVLRAAYQAVRDGESIGMYHLEHAANLEYRERGSIHIGGRLT